MALANLQVRLRSRPENRAVKRLTTCFAATPGPVDPAPGAALDVRALYRRQVSVIAQEAQVKKHEVPTLTFVVSLEPPGLQHSIRAVVDLALGFWHWTDAGGSQLTVIGKLFHPGPLMVQNGGMVDARSLQIGS
jgi:hypothetical protein